MHITLRAVADLRSFRSTRVFPALRAALSAASKPAFRLVHFSVQSNHVHLMVEADSRKALCRGVQGLAIRTARAVNRATGRRGRVWADRYHARALTTPREVRHALVYILMNFKKHGAVARAVDFCSSGPWFTGWRRRPAMPPPGAPCPVVAPRTWLAREGWRRDGGLIAVSESPGRVLVHARDRRGNSPGLAAHRSR